LFYPNLHLYSGVVSPRLQVFVLVVMFVLDSLVIAVIDMKFTLEMLLLSLVSLCSGHSLLISFSSGLSFGKRGELHF